MLSGEERYCVGGTFALQWLQAAGAAGCLRMRWPISSSSFVYIDLVPEPAHPFGYLLDSSLLQNNLLLTQHSIANTRTLLEVSVHQCQTRHLENQADNSIKKLTHTHCHRRLAHCNTVYRSVNLSKQRDQNYLPTNQAAKTEAYIFTFLLGKPATERSHEENQERAYIAASRRADRSLEARVQSARMASEIHRRRTGRGLKVTEEIVIKEEMYEEEEDDLPRQYKYLTAHLQTNSPAMNHRVNAYITTQAAMATMARYNEVNKLFSESFPSANAYQQQLNQSMYMSPLLNNGSSHFSPTSPTQAATPTTHGDQYGNMTRRISTASHASASNAVSSPPALSPVSGPTDAESRSTPFQAPAQAFPSLDPQLHQSSSSIFTSELPNEAKMMANVDMSDPMAPHFFGGANPVGLAPPQQSLNYGPDSALYSPMDPFSGFDGDFDFSRMGTPGMGMNEGSWESFVDFGPEQ
ncbi:hypothetical protein PG988_008044 [Apiospora saccharicola]